MATVIQFQSIGVVRNEMQKAHRDTHWKEIESKIIVDEKWRDALDGIEQFSHLWIVFYFDRMPPVEQLRVHPMARAEIPLTGIFATRTPQRPNPIGIRAVPLLEIHDNVLRVRGLDALDGTPVLDIKPYHPNGDAIENARVAEWVNKYWRESPESKP